MASKQQGLARDREGCHGAGPRASALPFALEQAMSASRQPTTAAGSRLDHAGDSRSDQGTERFLQDLLVALTAARAGEATRLDTRRSGLAGEVARAYNELLDQNTRFSRELARVAKVVGQDRKRTRLNSSHEWRSYAGFCLEKKKEHEGGWQPPLALEGIAKRDVGLVVV